ncbi:MAG: 50S ribosomal protein L5 [Deltaproteobacteria bacterium]|jgi:large subunit ribosomal protein L5|nr:50S ribosomal protein L5 [Deltaproteobacteria bacterium]
MAEQKDEAEKAPEKPVKPEKAAKPAVDAASAGGEAAPKKEKAAKAAGKGGKGRDAAKTAAKTELATEKVKRSQPPRLRRIYEAEIRAKLLAELGLKNVMQAPRMTKITVNMGLGEAITNPKILDSAVEDLAAITGQKPVVTKSAKAIAAFKLKGGQKIGAMVTLRRDNMYEFFDRLVTFALPRVRDFKGVSPKGFDGRGNFTMGIREGSIFPETGVDKLEKPKGMNITITTTARTDEQGRALLRHLGMPFRS